MKFVETTGKLSLSPINFMALFYETIGEKRTAKTDLALTTPFLEPSACEGAIDCTSQDG